MMCKLTINCGVHDSLGPEGQYRLIPAQGSRWDQLMASDWWGLFTWGYGTRAFCVRAEMKIG